MKKLLLFSGMLLFVFAVACSDSSSDEKKDSIVCKTPVNPNGDSELALVMRDIANWNDSIKAALQNGKNIPEAPASIHTILSAKRTDPNLDEALFSSGANHYLAQVEQFKTAGKADQVRFYNSMVNACVSCHQNFCGGPLKRINKMFIAEQ